MSGTFSLCGRRGLSASRLERGADEGDGRLDVSDDQRGVQPKRAVAGASQITIERSSCEKKHEVLALGMVADALAAHELEPELLLLREAVDAYADWSAHGDELRTRLAAAIIEAKSMLDDEAALVSLP